MKTEQQLLESRKKSMGNYLLKNIISVLGIILFIGCGNDDGSIDTVIQDPVLLAKITGSVTDQDSNTYPNTKVLLTGSSSGSTNTDSNGLYGFNNLSPGNYTVEIVKPLSTTIISESSISVSMLEGEESTADFIIQPQSEDALVVIGSVDIFGEIRDANGNVPTDDSQPLYAKNVFDTPFGLLTPIETPNDDPIVRSEWVQADGSVLVHCNGNSSTIQIALNGLIPNGTYTFWLNFLNKEKNPGDPVDFFNDVIAITPVGSGTLNVAIADSNGTIDVSIEHATCVLTGGVTVVMPVIYHLNGNTFGSAHIPDPEEASHMLIYFQ